MEVVLDDDDDDEGLESSKNNPNKKHTKKFHSLTTKLSVFKEYDKTNSVKEVCKKFNLSMTTVKRWLADRSNFNENKFSPQYLGCFRERKSSFGDIEEALFLWFDLATRSGAELTNASISSKYPYILWFKIAFMYPNHKHILISQKKLSNCLKFWKLKVVSMQPTTGF